MRKDRAAAEGQRKLASRAKEYVTSDHRVAGSSPAGCNFNEVNELRAILTAKSPSFWTVRAWGLLKKTTGGNRWLRLTVKRSP